MTIGVKLVGRIKRIPLESLPVQRCFRLNDCIGFRLRIVLPQCIGTRQAVLDHKSSSALAKVNWCKLSG